MRIDIQVTGYNKNNVNMGKATRILRNAESADDVEKSIAQIKSSIKVGQCGLYYVDVHDGEKHLARKDLARRGSKAAQIGTFAIKRK
jgi:hypothetical protein